MKTLKSGLAREEEDLIIYKFLIDGWTLRSLTPKLANEWGLAMGSARDKIENVYKTKFLPEQNVALELRKEQRIEQANELYRESLAEGNFAEARKHLDFIVKLEGHELAQEQQSTEIIVSFANYKPEDEEKNKD